MKTIELSVFFITVYVLQQMLGCLFQSELVHIPSSCYHMGGLISYLHHQHHHADFSTKNDLMAFSHSHDSLLRFVLWKIIPSAIRPLVMFSNKCSINPKSVNSLPLIFYYLFVCACDCVWIHKSSVTIDKWESEGNLWDWDCRSKGLTSVCQTWIQASLHSESSPWSENFLFG